MPLDEPRFNGQMTERANRRLQELGAGQPAVILAVLTSDDGFEIAAYRGGINSGRVAAMSSSLQALSEALVREAGIGAGCSVILEAQGGAIAVVRLAGTTLRASLSVVASGDETLGQLLWAARNCCQMLERDLQQ
jgi:predicted regulator of Ras-like GTPase activity (Roadblock/LC7/MglB family)